MNVHLAQEYKRKTISQHYAHHFLQAYQSSLLSFLDIPISGSFSGKDLFPNKVHFEE